MNTNHGLVCWKCGAELKGVILPLSRREVCAACNAEQHVCKLCRHYDPRVADMCREERAETVSNKERANFCDYFDPRAGLDSTPGSSRRAQSGTAARRQLDELFGNPAASGGGTEAGGDSAADKARAELEKLFGGDKPAKK